MQYLRPAQQLSTTPLRLMAVVTGLWLSFRHASSIVESLSISHLPQHQQQQPQPPSPSPSTHRNP